MSKCLEFETELESFQRIQEAQLPGISVFNSPVIFDSKDLDTFQEISKLCSELTQEFVASEKIQISPYCRDLNPKWISEIFRADLIYDPKTKQGHVIELNFGDPSGAGVMEAVYDCFFSLKENQKYRSLKRDHVARDIANSLCEFSKENLASEKPKLFLGMPTHASVYYDFQILQSQWKSQFQTFLGDPKDLSWDSKLQKFIYQNEAMDLLYRDSFFDWCPEGTDTLFPSVKACLNETGLFPGLSPLESRYLDSKALLPFYEEAAEKRGKKIFPKTSSLSSPDDLLKNRENWVLKSHHGYGGQDVHIGRYLSTEAWAQLISLKFDTQPHKYIMQEFKALPKIELELISGQKRARGEYSVLMSLWVIGGQYSGCIVRASKAPLINVHQNCGFAPAFYDL